MRHDKTVIEWDPIKGAYCLYGLSGKFKIPIMHVATEKVFILAKLRAENNHA